jgi:long-chain acyl-CoA synthetase
LDDAARLYPDAVYTIANGTRQSFSEVKETAERVASFLHAHGIAKGDRVAISLPNTAHFPAVFFGVLKAGAVCVCCNPYYTSSELHFQLSDAGAKALFCLDHPEQYPVAVDSIKDTAVELVVVCSVKSYMSKFKGFMCWLQGKIPKADRYEPDHLHFDQVLETSEPAPPEIILEPEEDLALIIYTTGTTGMAKGASLTHSNLTYDLMALEEWARLAHEPGGQAEPLRKGGFHTYMGVIPWYQSFGLTVGMLAACSSASRLICLADPREGEPPFTEALKSIEKHRATIMPAVPTVFMAFVNHPMLDKFDLTSLMGCFSGGAPLPSEVYKQFESKTGAVIFEGYGLSETAPVVASNPTSRSGRKIGTIGFPLPGTDVKILDMGSSGQEMPRGADGEIAVSGPQVMKGYWNKPAADREVFTEIGGRRYFLTGDIGHIDEEGYIQITDRKKDLVIVAGFNVYPKEIENILYEHPKIEMAVVVGIPDRQSGEAVKAHVQLRAGENATEEEIKKFCRKRLAAYKVPKIIEFQEQMPMSPGGKLLRRPFREEPPRS